MKPKFLFLCCFLIVLLAGCGEDPAPTPSPEPAVATSAPAAPTAAGVDTPTVAEQPTAQDPAPSPVMTETTPVTPVTDLSALSPEEAATATAGSGAVTQPVCDVEPNADLIGFEGLVERMGCPLDGASNDPVGINEFGAGPDYDRFMLWFGGEAQIYVLQPNGAWLAYADTWQEGDAEIGCNPDNVSPATSPPLPRRGFGKLWCTVDTVRIAMGTIDREERLCQHAVVQRFEKGKLLACFEDATIRYFRILDDGAWDMEMVQ